MIGWIALVITIYIAVTFCTAMVWESRFKIGEELWAAWFWPLFLGRWIFRLIAAFIRGLRSGFQVFKEN